MTVLTLQPYPPHTRLSINSLHQPTSKHMKRVLWNLFCLAITFLALWIHENTTTPTLSATPPSYPTYRLFPASTPLRMHETSSFNLVSCLRNFSSHTHITTCNSLDTLHHTPYYPTCGLFPVLMASKIMKQVCPIICNGWAGMYGGDMCWCRCGDEVEVRMGVWWTLQTVYLS